MYSGLFIGLLFGILLQRGQFCFVAGFRNLFKQADLRFLTALLLAISIQAIGFFSLAKFGLITIPTTSLPLLATLSGGFLFGFGMQLANACVSGACLRASEGVFGGWIVLCCFALTMAAAETGSLKHWLYPLLTETTEIDNIYNTLAISPWLLVGLLLVVTTILLYYQIKTPRYRPVDPVSKAIIFPKFFAQHWQIYLVAILLGILSVLAWWLSAKTGRDAGLSIAVPVANLVQYLVTGQQRYLNWGSLSVLGMLIGAFISAKLSGEFRVVMPPVQVILPRIVGGMCMGVGAALAGGCTVTNALVATAYFSWQAWLATLMMVIGCWVATYFVNNTQCRL
ncbi:YeeE/YedE family protein [[Haemophilus] ducreyi]|uniref:YeeE/YedE family protein n=1 Tax=Haemophilus ducreyi TaxID=730 RepID=UPI00065577A1|nr:YeeE/YedE family protein [[Haemophilus] ducreyi]AKO45231.1 ABC transporter permease [[Haemophilus] ducreyi]AKO46633.1 ABC transporter permease [[Haemophilus] ducreyi]AKO47974.1 ABC transporter permease [[Haemophilus] ducreyi]AKO49362.1 ABC transporter permease [[Haemophilus] ducreyi]ANF61600.1 ABC transporter permease [[Haemophilus] ducreyi]